MRKTPSGMHVRQFQTYRKLWAGTPPDRDIWLTEGSLFIPKPATGYSRSSPRRDCPRTKEERRRQLHLVYGPLALRGAVVYVPCGGETHAIQIRPSGQLILCDHPVARISPAEF